MANTLAQTLSQLTVPQAQHGVVCNKMFCVVWLVLNDTFSRTYGVLQAGTVHDVVAVRTLVTARQET